MLALSARITALLGRASRRKNRQADVRCDWSRQILQSWLASDERVKDDKGMFVLVTEDGMAFTGTTGVDFDLQQDGLR